MKLRRSMAFLLCAAMMATVLGSCGESSGESEPSSSQTQSSTVGTASICSYLLSILSSYVHLNADKQRYQHQKEDQGGHISSHSATSSNSTFRQDIG